MDNKKAAEILCKMPFWERFTDEEYTAMSMAIEAIENNNKLAEDLSTCLELYKKKKLEVKALMERNSFCPYCGARMGGEEQCP